MKFCHTKSEIALCPRICCRECTGYCDRRCIENVETCGKQFVRKE